jgi:hypothetical protein
MTSHRRRFTFLLALALVVSSVVALGRAEAATPTVALTSPTAGAVLKGTITLAANASSSSGIAWVSFWVDGNKVGADATAPYAMSYDTTKLANANHTFRAKAAGKDGVEAWSSQVTASVSNTVSAGGIYWGALIAGNVYGRATNAPWDATTLSLFEQHAGKGVSIIHTGQPWVWCSSTCSLQSFPAATFDLIRNHGSIPLLSWGSWAQPGGGANQPNFQLADITRGNYDSYIRSWAQAAKNWGKPFFLRFDWEMNLTDIARWAWQETKNGNRLGEYVPMWRHVRDIFTSVGATNVTWVWCPHREYDTTQKPLSSLYPGDAYVDWTCTDGYNNGTNPNGSMSGWKSFDTQIGPTYNTITGTVAPSKPLMIGETGSTEYGGSKADWITTTLNSLPSKYPKLKAFVWFNAYQDRMDWPIESSATAQQAFASAIQSSVFAPNAFASLSGGPIQALS